MVNDLESLKNEKTALLLELGQVTYYMMRGGDKAEARRTMNRIKSQIIAVDIKIHNLLDNGYGSGTENICAQCSAPIYNFRFCPSCGFDNYNSYNKDAVMCRVCNRLITDNSKFCTVCGFKLEG